MSFPRNTYVVYTKKTLTNENNIIRMNSVPLSPAASTIFFVRHSFSDSTVTLPMYTFHVGTSAFASRADRCLAFLCPLLRCSREQQHRWCFPMCWPWASLRSHKLSKCMYLMSFWCMAKSCFVRVLLFCDVSLVSIWYLFLHRVQYYYNINVLFSFRGVTAIVYL
jgi:hypothetical protein